MSSELSNRNPCWVSPDTLQNPQAGSFFSQGALDPKEASFDSAYKTGSEFKF